MTMTVNEPLFRDAHEALTFAFRHQHNQSPRTPMHTLLHCGKQLGSGRGLYGVDGAAQAGMVMRAVDRLSMLHAALVRVHYGDIGVECRYCHYDEARPPQWWMDLDTCSHGDETQGLNLKVRLDLTLRAVCGRGLGKSEALARDSGYDVRTTRRRGADLRERLQPALRCAVAMVEQDLQERGVVPAAEHAAAA